MEALDRIGTISSIVALPLSIVALLFTSPILNWWAKRSATKAIQRIKELESGRNEIEQFKNSESARSLYVQQHVAYILLALSMAAFLWLGRTEEKTPFFYRLWGVLMICSTFAAVLLSLRVCIALYRVRHFDAYDAETSQAIVRLKMRLSALSAAHSTGS